MFKLHRRSLLVTTTTLEVVLALAGTTGLAHAQTTASPTGAGVVEEIVVTGTRIRRTTDTASPAPVAIVGGQTVEDKGFLSAADALNELTSMSASRTATPTLANGQALPGQDFPNLFNLGPARTLSLINGRRTVSSSSGLGDEAVDENIIPTGLLERIDVVQGGGAAVYGSGAIAGVINYVMKDNYQGLTVQAQQSQDSRGDYRADILRAYAGRNFADGRGNISAEFDYSKNTSLTGWDRKMGVNLTVPNPAPGAGTGAIPRAIFPSGPLTQYMDPNGLIVINPTNGTAAGVLKAGNQGFTVDAAGNIVLKDLGTPAPGNLNLATNAAIQWPVPYLQNTFVPALERYIGNVIAHYDLTDNIKLRGELLHARVKATNPFANTVLHQFYGPFAGSFPGLAPIAFDRTNAYLTPAAVAQISAANPGFATGAPLWLSKTFLNLGSKYADQRITTDTTRALVALEGEFQAADRDFYWDLSYSTGRVHSGVDGYEIIMANLRRGAAAVRNSAGQIVCAVNATLVTDPGCVPINIFGADPLSPQQLAYMMGKSGTGQTPRSPVTNKQDDLMATFSGDLVNLPGGKSQFSVSYEKRHQTADYDPLTEDLIPQYFTGSALTSASGQYTTNELAAELSVPLLGQDFKLPLVESLSLDTSYRYVRNSLAGNNSVWGAGLRWDVGHGLVLRGTRSRNFRAPSLNQVLAPPVTTLAGGANPCARTNIGSGPSPSVRAANCLALFTANPTFGLATLAGAANTPQNRLANFTQTIVASVATTTKGNPNLQNEISKTWTFGFVYQPRFIPRLSISADAMRLNLKDAITLFGVANFAAACFDASPQPAELCSTLGYNADGDFNRGIASNVNAGALSLRAEIVTIDYRLPLAVLSSSLPGAFDFTLQATHNRFQSTTVAGVATRTDGTQTLPKWVRRLDAHYSAGPVRVNYSVNYLPPALVNFTATPANSNGGIYKLAANVRHDFSAEYRFRQHYVLRVGVNNFTDELPSFPTSNYGDIIGRTYFTALKAEF